MPLLTGVKIQFDTHNESKDDDTVVHVFIKNRLNNTQGSESNTDFISNYLDLQRYLDTGDRHDHTSSPYLAYMVGLAAHEGFDEGSSHEFDLNLMPQPVSVEDIVLPVVNVHMLANGTTNGSSTTGSRSPSTTAATSRSPPGTQAWPACSSTRTTATSRDCARRTRCCRFRYRTGR